MYKNIFIGHLAGYWGAVLWTRRWPQQAGTLGFKQILPLVLFNQFVITPHVIYLMSLYYPLYTSMDLMGVSEYGWKFHIVYPYLLNRIARFVAMVLTLNFGFFCTHWLSHKWKWFYKHIHNIHHQMIISIGAGAIYSHPIEHIFSSIGPAALAIWLFGGNDAGLIFLYICFVSFETVLGHTVYKKLTDGSRHHYHHFERGCNYGNSAYLEDKICGTFKDWEKCGDGTNSCCEDNDEFVITPLKFYTEVEWNKCKTSPKEEFYS